MMVFIPYAYINVYQKHVAVIRKSKNSLYEKQTKYLCFNTIEKLNQILKQPNIITFKKDSQLNFYDIKKINFTLDKKNKFDETVKVEALPFTTKIDEFYKFETNGTRLQLQDAINCEKIWSNIDNINYEVMKKRWKVLSIEDKKLPINLFEPIIKFISNNVCVFWNPYDRILYGILEFYVTANKNVNDVYQQQTKNIKIAVFMHPGETITYKTDNMILNVKQNQFNEILHNGLILQSCNSQIPIYNQYSIYDNQIVNKSVKMAKDNANQKPPIHKLKWKKTFKKVDEQKFDEITIFKPEIKFYTKTWVDKLNACLFFSLNFPYKIVGNLCFEKCKAINKVIWNEIVADNNAIPFNFNGTNFQIFDDFKKNFLKFTDVSRLKKISEFINKNGPYFDGYTFISKIVNHEYFNIEDLQNFKALMAKSANYKIESTKTIKNKIYKCTVDVDFDFTKNTSMLKNVIYKTENYVKN